MPPVYAMDSIANYYKQQQYNDGYGVGQHPQKKIIFISRKIKRPSKVLDPLPVTPYDGLFRNGVKQIFRIEKVDKYDWQNEC